MMKRELGICLILILLPLCGCQEPSKDNVDCLHVDIGTGVGEAGKAKLRSLTFSGLTTQEVMTRLAEESEHGRICDIRVFSEDPRDNKEDKILIRELNTLAHELGVGFEVKELFSDLDIPIILDGQRL